MADYGIEEVVPKMAELGVSPDAANGVDALEQAPIPEVEPEKYHVYEWLDEFGDVPPHNERLKTQLFEVLSKTMTHEGEHLNALNDFTVTVEGKGKIDPIAKFEDAGLHPIIVENIELCGYHTITPIQSVCIPAILQGKELLACAQTGTGKTAAYLIPVFSRLMGKYKALAAPRANVGLPLGTLTRAEPLVLIIAPTRELALQIYDHTRRLSYRTMLRPVCIFGGGKMGGPYGQQAQLQKGCDILIATPGRLMHFLNDPRVLSLRRVKFTVLDEADELLQLDWVDEIDRILFGGDANLDADHRMLMFSATFSEEAREVAREYMGEGHPLISVGRIGSSHANIHHEFIEVDWREKREKLYELLSKAENIQRTIIFCNTKNEVDKVDDFLFNKHLPVACTHSGRPQDDREEAMRQFRSGEKAILVTTAVFARGIDVADVFQILNYDLPTTAGGGITEFVHRIGRTARMGNTGHALTFFTDRNSDLAPDLANLLTEIGQPIPDFMKEHLNTEDDGEAGEANGEGGFGDTGDNGDSGGNGGNAWGAGATKDATPAGSNPWDAGAASDAAQADHGW